MLIRWTKNEIELLKKNAGESMECLQKLFPNRTPQSLFSKANSMNIILYCLPQSTRNKGLVKTSEEHRKKQSEALKNWWIKAKREQKDLLQKRSEKLSLSISTSPVSYTHRFVGTLKHVPLNIPGIRSGYYKKCEQCEKEFYLNPKRKARFCSVNCMNIYFKIHGGPKKGRKFSDSLTRKELIETIGKCEVCGFSDKEILIVHHIDKNKRKNNKRENLLLVCPNCHTKIHFKESGILKLKGIPST